MANRRVRVVRSVKLNGKWTFINPNRAQRLHIPNQEGRWYISWRLGTKKEWQRADSWTHAMSLKLKKEAELHAVSAGLALPAADPRRLKVEDAIEQLYEDLKLRDRRSETLAGYRLVFDTFKPVCQRTYLDQIDRKDMLKFAAAMRKAGLSPRTVSNRWLAFSAFLKHHGITGLTKRYDAPRFVESEAEAYSQEDVQKFLAACNDEQRLLYSFYLKTGFRMQEVMYLQFSDIDFKQRTVSVRAKPSFDFRPKSWKTPLDETRSMSVMAMLQQSWAASRNSRSSPQRVDTTLGC